MQIITVRFCTFAEHRHKLIFSSNLLVHNSSLLALLHTFMSLTKGIFMCTQALISAFLPGSVSCRSHHIRTVTKDDVTDANMHKQNNVLQCNICMLCTYVCIYVCAYICLYACMGINQGQALVFVHTN
jgi:hypothetical protein